MDDQNCVVDIVNGASNLFKNVNMTSFTSRKLMSEGPLVDGFPTWMSESWRKILTVVNPYTDFDEGKRSCRRKLERHNTRRRRKPPAESGSAAQSELLQPVNQNEENNYDAEAEAGKELKVMNSNMKKDYEKISRELKENKTLVDLQQKKFTEVIQKNATKNSSLQMPALEQMKADENFMKLAEDLKRQKEELHAKIIQLQKQLDMKQGLELEIQQLKGSLCVLKHMEDAEVLKKVDTLQKDLRDKEQSLQDIDALNQTLIIKERESNDELQEARHALVEGIKELQSHGNISLKRMGELDTRPVLEAMKKRYNEEEAEERASELCSLWEEYLKDPDWHPFKVIMVEGKEKEIIRDDDEKLNGLLKDLGEGVYKAVVEALLEINEHNPGGGYLTSVSWNYKQGRRATLKEGVQYLLNHWKVLKRKRGLT